MIKRIACLCTLGKSDAGISRSELIFSVFDDIRRQNKQNNIVGIFLICDNILCQILEGESSALGNIMYRVRRDPRLIDTSIILNSEINSPSFKRWNLKLIDHTCQAHTDYTAKIFRAIKGDINTTTAADSLRLNTIFNECKDNSNDREDEHTGFNNTLLSMTSWPRPTQLRLTANLMKLCPLLIGRHVEYSRLLELNVLGTEAELNDALTALRDAKALNVVPGATENNIHPLPTPASVKTNAEGVSKFSNALKNFISNHRLKGARP